MANSYFQFKQFTIRHDKCGMKVGTDAVLLGSWTRIENCRKILDIGTGSGIIALMLAQRSQAAIDAIDIDKEACIQAQENVQAAPFNNPICVIHSDLAHYARICNSHYDLIVSNPPYFINSLKCPDQQRNTARHTDTLFLSDLLQESCRLLAPAGRIALVLPYEQLDELRYTTLEKRLHIIRQTHVIPCTGGVPKRLLIELSKEKQMDVTPDILVIEESRHQYTEEYKALTRDFYLKM